MAKFLFITLVSIVTCICGVEQYVINSNGYKYDTVPPLNDYELKVGKSLIDRIIDLVLQKLRQDIVEPIILQDEIVSFNKKVIFVPVRGELALYNGELRGANTIERKNDAEFSYHNLHEINVNCSFYFQRLDFIYNFQANLYNRVSTDGKVTGDIEYLVTNAGINIDPVNKSVQLTSLTLDSAKSIDMQLASEKYVDKLINLVFKLFTSNFKSTILNQIQNQLQTLLKQKFYY